VTALVRCNGRPWCKALVQPGRVCNDCRSAQAKGELPGGHPAERTHRTVDVADGARREKDRKTPGTDPLTDTHRTAEEAQHAGSSFTMGALGG
jgi:hypothetical protein